MSGHQEDRALLEKLAAACGFDTTHSYNALRMTLAEPCVALCIREKHPDGHLRVKNTAWNPLDTASVSGAASALELAARFRLCTGFEKRFRQFGECAYASYKSGVRMISSKLVNVHDAGGAEQAMARAICLAVIAQHEAGQ